MSSAATSQRSMSRDALPGTTGYRTENARVESSRRVPTAPSVLGAEMRVAGNPDLVAVSAGVTSSTTRASRRRGESRATKHDIGSSRTRTGSTSKVVNITLPSPNASHSRVAGPSTSSSSFSDIPNATPPSPRLPYFAKYPNRAERLRATPDSSPYQSSDNETTKSSRLRPFANQSGAYSDTSPSAHSGSRSRVRTSGGEADDVDSELSSSQKRFAWPAKIASSELQRLQVPLSTPSTSSEQPTSSISTSPSPSPLSSRSNSPPKWNRTRDHDQSPSTPSAPAHVQNLWRHKFPAIQSDPVPDIKTHQKPGEAASLLVPSGFDVSAMDALVDQINGGHEHSAVSDLAHLSTSAWPAPKALLKSTSSLPRHHNKYPETRSSRARQPPKGYTRAQTAGPRNSPITTYHPTYSSSSPPPSLSRSSATSDLSSLTSPLTDRSSAGGEFSHPSTLSRKVSNPSTPTSTTAKALVPSISDIIRAHAPDQLKNSIVGPKGRQGSSVSLPRSFGKTTITSVVPNIEEEPEAASRSSMDSIAEEALRSMQLLANPDDTSTARQTTFSSLHMTSNGDRRQLHPSSAPSSPQTPTWRSIAGSCVETSQPVTPSEMSFGASSTVTHTSSPGISSNPSATDHPPTPTYEMAQYLRSPRLTRLVSLRRGANAGITVSLADVGSSGGRPVLLYLGLGCVRYIIGLYDEMAEALGIRLICIDRWGLGRTTDVPSEKRGMLEWAGVVEEVVDHLGIDSFGIIAHSAGAPYALASALKLSTRIHGSIHLLAPWVSQSVDGGEFPFIVSILWGAQTYGHINILGYKWLKYIPASLIKTAQTAEWKMHGWKIGKPPTIAWEGIGFDANSASIASQSHSVPEATHSSPKQALEVGNESRPSFTSSEYDDLADFNGRFSSSTNLNKSSGPTGETQTHTSQSHPVKKKSSFLALFEGRPRRQPSLSGSIHRPSTSRSDTAPPTTTPHASASRLRSTKSKSSLRSKSSIKYHSNKARSTPPLPDPTPPSLQETNPLPSLPNSEDLTLNDLSFDISAIDTINDWGETVRGPKGPKPSVSHVPRKSTSITDPFVSNAESNPRSDGKRSISLSPRPVAGSKSAKTGVPPLPAFAINLDFSPPSPTFSQASITAPSISARSTRTNASSAKASPYHTGLGATATAAAAKRSQKPGGISLASALMQASHAEAFKGGTADLLSILERPDSRPWGFSYTDVKQHVKVWYGDRDERIGISSVRWMERAMKDCEVKIIKGEDHSLLTNAKVVVEVMESIAAEWK